MSTFFQRRATQPQQQMKESQRGRKLLCVNACNPSAIKRTWQQLKMKYQNIIQSANRKKAEACKTGGGPAPLPLTDAEEMALSLNTGRPVAEGIPGGSSSEPVTPQDTSTDIISYSDGNICLVEPLVTTEPQALDEGDEETLSADTERSTELPVKELFKIHLIKQLQNTDKERVYLDRQILKTDLEIELLRHKLEVGVQSNGTVLQP
ncbi:putative myb/SANT-like DNA-binding domain-containing protein 4-like [Triplophysa rosa]|uniref:Myb/SANT-like DNA-binding domain-containing protein 4-like n=1 Tax=Triplophysa rosa TaxID=992332 RepID=A0A9W7WL43_TRIRA|nr:putative myb/SANT-like DNA-binding domain-containing protein 4-like [Triplophysa rosa]